MLSLDAVGTFDRVSHIRLLHTLKMRRTPSYIIEWTRSFLKDRESSLVSSLIEKCEPLGIKIEVLGFVDNINILAYDRSTEAICETLSKAHDACTGWARTTFAPEKYKLTQFTRKSNRFDMTASLRIENSVIKPKSDVRVLEVQLNMKLGWGSHLRQIEAGHATRMLALSCLEAFT